ncbi:hypothetical protein VPH35_040525 [Triticum aestivum]|uniref:crossover junction endonuclease EME1 n=1 Tax=Triticum aestivum TaxID=4565 RepID=UPI0008443CA8|nr:crossover junction endonuclease EME1-like [Triticum aestivum]
MSSLEDALGDSAMAPTMASRVSAARIAVVELEDDDDDTAASTPAPAPRSRASRGLLDASSSSPAFPKRRLPMSPIFIDDDTPPPPPKRREPGSAAPGTGTPPSFVPCSLAPRPRAAAPGSFLPSPFRFGFGGAALEIPGPSAPGSIDPDIVVLETPGYTPVRRVGASLGLVPCSLSPRSGGDGPRTPDSVLRRNIDFEDAADLEIPGSASPGSADPDVLVLETPGFTASRPAGPSSVPIGTPPSFVPCSLAPQSRGAAVPNTPVLPRSFDFDAADLGIPGPAFPGSVAPNAETRFFTNSRLDVAGPSTFRGASSPISLDSDDELDGFGYKEPSDNLILPCEEPMQEEERNDNTEEGNTKQERMRLIKEGKAKMVEEKKRQREENKLMKEAIKAQKAEQKKYAKEKDEWESGKHALRSIVAEIDSTIIETGSVGGTLLTRFAEKGLKYRVQVNPIRGSILWKMEVPQIGQDPASVSEVPYILFVLQAEEFCDLINSGSFWDHVHLVQDRYPTFTVCFVTNKLMNYINKCERAQYRNAPNFNSWKRPPVEEVLCKLATHHVKVHSRQCADEAEVADHIVGLTSSLANCRFRKPLSWLSVHANGAVIPKNFIDKDLAKKDTWMKALIAIPKVQPRFALAIWKKYSTMRSLLKVYMDSTKTVREKELLLQDLKCEDRVGDESRRLGPVCSRRVYRTLMAEDGAVEADAAAE